jgi:hypothetical protein
MPTTVTIVLMSIGALVFLGEMWDMYKICTDAEYRKKHPKNFAIAIVGTVLLIGILAIFTYLNAIRVL